MTMIRNARTAHPSKPDSSRSREVTALAFVCIVCCAVACADCV